MEKYSSLLSPGLVLSAMRQTNQYQDQHYEENIKIDSALVLSCLNKAGQSSLFFTHSFHENLEDIIEETEIDLEFKTEVGGDSEIRIFILEVIIASIVDNVFKTLKLILLIHWI